MEEERIQKMKDDDKARKSFEEEVGKRKLLCLEKTILKTGVNNSEFGTDYLTLVKA